jgi:hypothetical protein
MPLPAQTAHADTYSSPLKPKVGPYGREWGDSTPLDIELAMFRETWSSLHFWNIVELLWPATGPKPFDRNPWAERMVEAALKHPMLSISGAASSGKSDTAAVLAIVCWLSDPLNMLVMVTSTSLGESRRRIWGSIVDYWNAIPAEVRLLGKLVDHAGLIKINPATGIKASNRSCIQLIPGEKRREKEAVGKLIGAKNFRVLLICDEMPELSPALLEAAKTNLRSNRNFHLWGLGNPATYYDAHGVFSKPRAGWDSITIDSEEWETEDGWAIRFDAERSPNLLHDPTGTECPWPYLPTKARLEEARESLGEHSFGYYRQWRGFWFPEGADSNVFSGADLVFFGAHRTKIEWMSTPTPIGGLDPGFTAGGDRSMAYFGVVGVEASSGLTVLLATEYVLLTDDPRDKTTPRNFQIAQAFRKECEKRGVSAWNAGSDVTGAPAFGDVLAAVWSPDVLRVTSNGKSSKRAMGVNRAPANSRFATQGTEIWFGAREMMQTRQLCGVGPDVSAELIERRYYVLSDVVSLEPKKEMKRRTGKSPDLADAFLVMTEVARARTGLKVDLKKSVRAAGGAPASDSMKRWKEFKEKSSRPVRHTAFRREGVRAKSKFGKGLSLIR